MSREESLVSRLKGLFKDFEGTCKDLSYADQEYMWNTIFQDPYEEIMQELERL